MKIGILGTRGIPNAYGGFEQFAQYLAQDLSEKGHEIFVYNSSNHPYQEKIWGRVNIIHCKDWEKKIGIAGQFIYDLNCFMDARGRNFDILLQLGYTSNSIWHWLWPRNTVNIVNMDGLEWKRTKYNRPTQLFLKKAEKWAAKNADILISDSLGIQEHILKNYNRSSFYIPYGAEIPEVTNNNVFSKWDLERDKYYLLVARMEPENNIEMIILGYLASIQTHPLILVGGTDNKFGNYLKTKYKHPNVRFIGAVYDASALNALRQFSAIYFHGHSVGGTNPSLLEAMGCGCNIIANDNIFNRAILRENASYFSTEQDLKATIDHPISDSERCLRRERSLETIKEQYNWPLICNAYEKIFLEA